MWCTCYRLKREFGRRVETFTNQKRVPSLPSKSALESNLLKLNSICFLRTPFLCLCLYLFTMFIKTWILLCWSKLLNLEFLCLSKKFRIPIFFQVQNIPSTSNHLSINWQVVGTVGKHDYKLKDIYALLHWLLAFFPPSLSQLSFVSSLKDIVFHFFAVNFTSCQIINF